MTQDILAISAISTNVERVFNLKQDLLSYCCSSLVVNIILNIMMIKHANAVKLKAKFSFTSLLKRKELSIHRNKKRTKI